MEFVISFFLNLFSYCALIAIDATNEQSDTTVCLTLKQSTISKTRGFDINSSGLAHLDSFDDCFVESLRLPCLSEVPFKFRNQILYSIDLSLILRN